MTWEEIKKIFDECFNNQHNVLTPNIIDYKKYGPYVIEISRDNFGYLYGLTCLIYCDGKWITHKEFTKSYTTLKELNDALDYIERWSKPRKLL